MIDIKAVKEQAEKEVREEREQDAKKRIKSKMKELDAAKKIVVNLERELTDLYDELSQSA